MLFRKRFAKTETKAQESAAREGFFSTDNYEPGTGNKDQRLKAALDKSIQVKPGDMKITDKDGKTTAFSGDSLSYGSKAFAYGNYGGVPEAQINWYANQGFIGYQMCAILAQHWLIDKACSVLARDAVRNGFEISVNDGKEVKPEVFDAIRELNNEFQLVENLREQVRQGRIFGIRHTLFQVESSDPLYYEKPFNIDGVKPGSYKGMSQIDPYWITPQLDLESASNPFVRSFYEPTWWIINGRRYHRSHFVVMITNEVPDVLKPSYFYGGVSVPQKIYERVYAAERTANEAPMLTMTKRLNTLKIDTTKALANEDAFNQRMLQWTAYRDNFGVKVIGGDEEVDQKDTSLADLDNVIMTQYQIVAAIAETPATRLLGTTPKGFNSTGEYEEASYHETLESIQEHDLTPLVKKHIQLIIKSIIEPKFKVSFDPVIRWEPLDAPTAVEIADINLKNSQADMNYANAGGIDGMDIRARLIGDPNSGYNGIPDIMPEPQQPDDSTDPAEAGKKKGDEAK